MSKILIKGATVITMEGHDQVFNQGEIAVEGNRIVAVGPKGTIDPDWQADQIIDGTGLVAMPGLINCHTHAAMTMLRSYADDLPLMQWLEEKIWPLEDKLVGEDVYWGTKLCILEMIKSGTTTFADMYFYMDEVAKAVEETGIRADLSRGMIGINPNSGLALEQIAEFIPKWHGAANGRITCRVGPHAPHTCPPEYLEKVMKIAGDTKSGVHIHVAETQYEFEEIMRLYGKTPVGHLNSLGLLDFQVLAAHCVHLTDEDIAILAQKQVGVAHNPESNMKLASGIAPVPKMLKAGVIVGLGTDGAASNNNLDLLQEMRTAALLHKVNTMDPAVLHSFEALQMATVNGAKALGLQQEIGVLKAGYKADIILVDFEKPHLYPHHDYIANLVYSAQSGDVKTVLIDGQVVMEDYQMTTMDEKEIMKIAGDKALNLVGPK